MTTPLLQVENLQKNFRLPRERGASSLLRALDDVSFSVASGQTLAIVGESGSGKTTTGRIIVGLEEPSAGTVTFGGQLLATKIHSKDRKKRAKLIQMVFQNPAGSLSPMQTAEETLREVVAFHTNLERQECRTRVYQLLDQVGIARKDADRRPADLSGGQCQRVTIARSLASRPKLLVLDEAVSALDVSTQAQILNLLDSLRRDLGVAIVLITHDLAVVRQLCDHVLVMQAGRIVESGDTTQILDHPSHPYTIKLRSSVPESGL